MKLTNVDVDTIAYKLIEHEKSHTGIRLGEDFAEFALVVDGSEYLKRELLLSTMTIAFIMPEFLKKILHNKSSHELVQGKDNPLYNILVEALYHGYQLGRKEEACSCPER